MDKQMESLVNNPYLMGHTNPSDVSKMYDEMKIMYSALQNQPTQPILKSQLQDEFCKGELYATKMQDFFLGYLLSKFGMDFRASKNYIQFEQWANDEFKVFESNYNKKEN